MNKAPKIEQLSKKVCEHLDSGRYLDTRLAEERKVERSITRAEVIYVLKNGYHEKRKDQYDETHSAWNYAVRGKTVDQRELRVIISFDENDMLIITAIDLNL